MSQTTQFTNFRLYSGGIGLYHGGIWLYYGDIGLYYGGIGLDNNWRVRHYQGCSIGDMCIWT